MKFERVEDLKEYLTQQCFTARLMVWMVRISDSRS